MHTILSVLLFTTLCSEATLRVHAKTVKPNQLDSGECLNKSQDADCNSPRSASQTEAGPDDEARLRARIETIDQLQSDGPADLELYAAAECDPTLRQVIFLHRHGDRTPIMFPPKDNLASEPFWTFHGLGQLTNRGKARLFLLGKIIRERYNSFLGASVNKNQRVTRSSGSLRCIESAQTFLASFLSLELPDSPDASELVWDHNASNKLAHIWQPASIQAVPAKLDGMLAESAQCNSLTEEFLNVIDKTQQVEEINKEYVREAEVLRESYGFHVDHFYKWFWASSQIEVERSYFPDKVKPEILECYDRIQDAGNKAFEPFQSTVKSKRLKHGLLMGEWIDHMKKIRASSKTAGGSSLKFAHYAAHDLTLVTMLGMLGVWEQFGRQPDYASNLTLELHEKAGEWYVRFFYMERVPSLPVEVHVASCEDEHPLKRCTLDRFAELMKPYTIDSWEEWMRECRNDLTKLNPYAPGS